MRYRKKPVVIIATPWEKDGDHPNVVSWEAGDPTANARTVDEGCGKCGVVRRAHGWVETLEGGHVVCPGDFVITGVKGEHYPCKPDIFYATYDPVRD